MEGTSTSPTSTTPSLSPYDFQENSSLIVASSFEDLIREADDAKVLPFEVTLPYPRAGTANHQSLSTFCNEHFGPDAIPSSAAEVVWGQQATWVMHRDRRWTWMDTSTFRFADEEDAVAFLLFAS